MNKKARQYIGLVVAIAIYYVVHEGAHLMYSLAIGTFKQIKFMTLGMQIDIYLEKMTQAQIGLFCILGSVATIIASYALILLIGKIGKSSSKLFKACAYYTTIAMLFIDPLYLSLLCSFFGGGDMNGISILIPQVVARIGYGIIFVINIIVLVKIVLPRYRRAFGN